MIYQETYYLLQFFTGNFETFYNESIKNRKMLGWTNSFEKTLVYIWLLLLNENFDDTLLKEYSKHDKELRNTGIIMEALMYEYTGRQILQEVKKL